jgi:uncharacterized membrane-anchored protein YhcB (DUF1043 family)
MKKIFTSVIQRLIDANAAVSQLQVRMGEVQATLAAARFELYMHSLFANVAEEYLPLKQQTESLIERTTLTSDALVSEFNEANRVVQELLHEFRLTTQVAELLPNATPEHENGCYSWKQGDERVTFNSRAPLVERCKYENKDRCGTGAQPSDAKRAARKQRG